jgi:hypothetical protein
MRLKARSWRSWLPAPWTLAIPAAAALWALAYLIASEILT